MTIEEKKEDEGQSAPASEEEKPKDQNQDENQGDGGEDQHEAKPDEKDKKISELTSLTEKQKTQIEQAGYNIQKLKEKMKEAGVEVDEEKGLSQEQVQELLKKQEDELNQKIDQKVSEILKAVAGKGSPNATGTGQKPPTKKYPVPDSDEVRRLLQKPGYKWDGETGLLITPSGRKVDLNDRSDISQ